MEAGATTFLLEEKKAKKLTAVKTEQEFCPGAGEGFWKKGIFSEN